MQDKKRTWGKFILEVVFLVALFTLVQYFITTGILNRYYQINLTLMGINVILAVSLNLINGFTGQLSLGHAGFMAIGAFASVIMTTMLEYPFIIGIIIAMLAAASGIYNWGTYIKTKRRLPGHCYPGIWGDYPGSPAEYRLYRRTGRN